MSQDPLALTVYHWGMESQSRLLVECLEPTVEELVSRAALRHFWFDRYDARGPHLFAVLLPRPGGEEDVRRELETRLDAYLEHRPSTEALSQEELEQRHTECRGRAQSEADTLPGLAENNTYLLSPHPAEGYPYGLSWHLPGHEEIWDRAGDLSRWAIRRLATERYSPSAEVTRFAIALDRELEHAGADPGAYWRYHAATLLPSLAEPLRGGDPATLEAIPGLVGEVNLRAFTEVWGQTGSGALPWQPLPRLLELTLARSPGPAKSSPWGVQREIDHTLFKQLALPVAQHIPVVLYALWRRASSG